jgi:hypothetical protein
MKYYKNYVLNFLTLSKVGYVIQSWKYIILDQIISAMHITRNENSSGGDYKFVILSANNQGMADMITISDNLLWTQFPTIAQRNYMTTYVNKEAFKIL